MSQSRTEKPQLLCILFSDLKGYSGLRNDPQKNQIVQEMKTIFERASRPGVRLLKTMGDGMMAACETPLPLAETALAARDAYRNADWKSKGFPEDFLIRIGLHIDEMIVHYDADGRIVDAIGVGVDATARIEPVTKPNAVFCSARFYELLQGRGVGKIRGIPQGSMKLAKQYGEMELYELRWLQEADEAARPVTEPSNAPSIPMPKIKKSFSDKDRRDYLRGAFAVIRQYFDAAVKQLIPLCQGLKAVSQVSATPNSSARFI